MIKVLNELDTHCMIKVLNDLDTRHYIKRDLQKLSPPNYPNPLRVQQHHG